MRIRGKLVLDVIADDLTALIDAKVPESRVLEYKSQLPGAKDDDKKEFLADVSAMANTVGGVILYGVETERAPDGKDTGIPASVSGIDATNLDAEILRLQNMLRDGIHPALTRVAFARIALGNSNRTVVAIGISRALVLPHMIAFQRSGRVYRRSDVDKYQVDVHELRRMVLESDDWTAAADAFRRGRIGAVRAGEIVPNVWPVPAVMLHVLPLGRLDAMHDLRPVDDALMQALPPYGTSGWDRCWNFDGRLYYAEMVTAAGQSQCFSFVQWFRAGGIETYSAQFHWAPHGAAAVLDGNAVNKYVRSAVRKAITALMDTLAVDPPFIVLLTLVGTRGTTISPGGRFAAPARGLINKDDLFLPAVVLDDTTTDVDAVLQPMLDVMWQAAGWSGAPPVGGASR